MKSYEPVLMKRDCEAVLIPSGEKIVLKKESMVHITQALGGSYTVMTETGYLARIDGQDADAIGQEKPSLQNPSTAPEKNQSIEKSVYDQLKTCFDPEIPVNIVDLGLIYECHIDPIQAYPDSFSVDIKMTLTAPGCGMGDWLKLDVENKVASLPAVRAVHVQLVWDPPWDQTKMTDAAKLHLGML